MTANRSTAVMQRRKVAPDSLDYFPTPPFATRALCEFLVAELSEIEWLDPAVRARKALKHMTAWEPGCGEMHMVRPLREYFGGVRASDVYRYGPDHELIDFAFFGDAEPPVDVVACNPPFRLAQAFIETGLKVARRAVAMLVRSAFLESAARYEQLWTRTPPSFVLQFVERVVMLEGRLIRAGATDPFAERAGNKASSATAYVWLVWIVGNDGPTVLKWLPPSLQRLERPDDYPDYVSAMPTPPAEGLFGEAQSLPQMQQEEAA